MRQPHHSTTVWWVLIGLTTAFIWGQSLLTRDLSSLQSESVKGLLGNVLGEWIYETFIYHHIRKVAHFAEYALPGIEWTALQRASHRNIPLWIVCLAGPVTAICDELLQFISARAPMMTDVLLDCGGYAIGCLVMWGLYILTHRCRRK